MMATPKPTPKSAPPPPAAKTDARAAPGAAPEPAHDKPPGTPTTPPEGHDRAEPGPGQPGGPSAPKLGKGEPDPPARTAADEQRERSESMQGEGMQSWKDRHDERDPDEKPKAVPGVQHRPVEAHEAQKS